MDSDPKKLHAPRFQNNINRYTHTHKPVHKPTWKSCCLQSGGPRTITIHSSLHGECRCTKGMGQTLELVSPRNRPDPGIGTPIRPQLWLQAPPTVMHSPKEFLLESSPCFEILNASNSQCFKILRSCHVPTVCFKIDSRSGTRTLKLKCSGSFPRPPSTMLFGMLFNCSS